MKSKFKRILVLGLCLSFALGCMTPACAAGARCDEAYYATLDYYGALTDSSVVKSYALDGNSSITDYGDYDEVINLTDDRQPVYDGGKLSFSFDENAPEHFYFEGKTEKPFSELPWRFNISYKLNGVETKAETLAGKSGVVEIDLDVTPNPSASEYSRNNLVLTAATAFNADDILSLEAPGAEVQLLGNLRTVLFMALPGEEQHFAIRVGTENFSFSGMMLLAVPATLSQLDKIADLRDAKEDIEDSYDKLTEATEKILDSLDGMSGSLNAAANGLDQLNTARGQISAGKNTVYGQADLALEDLDSLAEALEPMNGHLDTASQAVDAVSESMGALCDTAVSLKEELKTLRGVLDDLRDDLDALDDLRGELDAGELKNDFDRLGSSLKKLQSAMKAMTDSLAELEDIEGEDEVTIEGMTVSQLEASVRALNAGYAEYSEAVTGLGGTPSPEGYYQMVLLPKYENNEAAAQKAYTLWQYSKTDAYDSRIAAAKQVNTLLNTFNMSVSQLKALTGTVSEGAEPVLSALDSLCSALGSGGLSGDLSGLMDALDDHSDDADDALEHADDLLDTLDDMDVKAAKLLEQTDELHTLLDSYIPDVQAAISDSKELISATGGSLRDLRAFLGSLESLLRESGKTLDSGTQQTLSGLADALRRSTVGLDQTGNIRDAQNVITDIIEEKWDSYTGEENNLLLMDAGAKPVSMTSSKNGAPESIQYVMRTQEISADSGEAEAAAAAEPEEDIGFFGRVAQMFAGIWHFITGLFS
ncbi:MAG: hypothetical protein ACOX81_09170 [Candidatus Heteroscillospira sp.]|jgi:putative membrane protein